MIGIVSSGLPAVEEGAVWPELAFLRYRRCNFEKVACRAEELVGELEDVASESLRGELCGTSPR